MFKVNNKGIKTVPRGRCTAVVIDILNKIHTFVFRANSEFIQPSE